MALEIYCRTNTVNGKVYIGQCTREGDPRWSESISEAKHSKGWRLGAAIRKYGKQAFKTDIIYIAKNQHELDMMEIFFILMYQSHIYGYNVLLGGQGHRGPHRQETKDKLRQINLGKISSLKRRKSPLRGRKLGPYSQERKDKISATLSSRYKRGELEHCRQRSKLNARYIYKLRRARKHICYFCYKPFDPPYNADRVFCSQRCSSKGNRLVYHAS